MVAVECKIDTPQQKVVLIKGCIDGADITEIMLVSSTRHTHAKKLDGVNSYKVRDGRKFERREV